MTKAHGDIAAGAQQWMRGRERGREGKRNHGEC
jgi:hypothetical protein